MLKLILISLLGTFSLFSAHAQHRDTSVFYYRYLIPGYQFAGSRIVKVIDSADYLRIISPPDSGEDLYNIQEFYKNGKLKFIGKSVPGQNVIKNFVLLQGTCISYFPNGKKCLVTNFERGVKQGMEYQYFPNGKLYFTLKYSFEYGAKIIKYLDCYNINGNLTAKEGNGHWITYDNDYRNVFIEGAIKNGSQDGEWRGATMDTDSIKFIYIYKKGVFVSATGFDKTGKEYPFKQTAVPAKYKNGADVFIGTLRQRIVLPKDENGKKIRDTVSVSFIVGKDGHLSDFQITGHPNPALATAVLTATKGCKDWMPRTYYGIPLRSKIMIPIDFTRTSNGFITYNEEALDIKLNPKSSEQ